MNEGESMIGHTTPDFRDVAHIARIDFAQLARVDGQHWQFQRGRHVGG